jgi:hypothetical protein
MRVFACLGLAAVVMLAGSGTPRLGAQSAAAPPEFVPGELIVKYRADAQPASRGRARAGAAVMAVAELARGAAARGHGHTELVRLSRGASMQAARRLLQGDPAVEYAEPNWIYRHQAAPPDDPMFGEQWALENSGQTVAGTRGIVDADIDALDGWSAITSGDRAYVGVLDEGIDFSHPDLGVQPGGPIWTNPFDPADGRDNDGNGYVDDVHGWDFVDQTNTVYDGTAADPQMDAHGTHVAGTLAARRNNGVGIAGVSRDVVIIPTKFLGASGGTTAGAVQALDYLTDLKIRHGLNIIATNNSWTGGGFSQAMLDAITRAAKADILFITAAGNGGPDEIGDDNDAFPVYPGSYDTSAGAGYDAVINVTATTQSDELAEFSNFGAATVDLAAPGSLILGTTPRNTYSFSTGTSMAVPHVTGAAILAHMLTGKTGADLREAVLAAVDPVSSLAGQTVTGGRLNLGRLVAPHPAPAPGAGEIVLYASDATLFGKWTVQADPGAAGGARVQSPNLGAPKVTPALRSPKNYIELTFIAEAGRPYHLWVRGRAESNHWANDSVHVQFDNTVTATGAAAYRIGTSSSAEVNLENCSGCGLSGWAWQDNGYGAGVQGPPIFFAATGPQRIRIQTREDGIALDQIVLSSGRFLSAPPGGLKNDDTILNATGTAGGPAEADAETVLYAAEATLIAGAWTRVSDASAAGGARLQNPDAGAPKLIAPLADPGDYFEMIFGAKAGRPYRLWIRARASGNNWANDSVHVQFSDAVTATGAPAFRIGSTSSVSVNLEDCTSCGLSGWGWQDNGYGAGRLGPELRFANTGMHTIRVQIREDGIGIDQIVLSAKRFLSRSPGLLKNDSVILTPAGQ